MKIKYILFTIALIVTLVISYDIYYWLSFWSQENNTIQKANTAYLKHVPIFLRNITITTLISTLLLVISILILLKTKTVAQLKKPRYVLIAIDIVLLFWMLFSLS